MSARDTAQRGWVGDREGAIPHWLDPSPPLLLPFSLLVVTRCSMSTGHCFLERAWHHSEMLRPASVPDIA
eukprot:3321651-Rhodomonas_salina.1